MIANMVRSAEQKTEQIARRARTVAQAMFGIEEELAELRNCECMVQSVTAPLGAVDDAVREPRPRAVEAYCGEPPGHLEQIAISVA